MSEEILIVPVPTTSEIDSLQESHNLVRAMPFGLQALSYSTVLPKGWVSEPDLGQQESTSGKLIKIGLFAEHISRNPAVVQVFYTNLSFEVGLKDWLEFESERSGVQVVHSFERDLACGRAADVVGLYGSVPNQFVVRSIAHVDNARIFLVSAMVEKVRYDSLAKDLSFATVFFQLIQPTGGVRFEPIAKVEGMQPDFSLGCPASWTMRAVPSNISGKSAIDIFLAKNEKMLAYIRVKAIDLAAIKSAPAASTDSAVAELQEAGVKLLSAWTPDRSLSLQDPKRVVDTYMAAASLAKETVEVRLGVVRPGPLEFALTLISVARKDDRILWMRSKRAYEIALDTVGIVSKKQ